MIGTLCAQFTIRSWRHSAENDFQRLLFTDFLVNHHPRRLHTQYESSLRLHSTPVEANGQPVRHCNRSLDNRQLLVAACSPRQKGWVANPPRLRCILSQESLEDSALLWAPRVSYHATAAGHLFLSRTTVARGVTGSKHARHTPATCPPSRLPIAMTKPPHIFDGSAWLAARCNL